MLNPLLSVLESCQGMHAPLIYGALACVVKNGGAWLALSFCFYLRASLLAHCDVSESKYKVLHLMYPFPQLHCPGKVSCSKCGHMCLQGKADCCGAQKTHQVCKTAVTLQSLDPTELADVGDFNDEHTRMGRCCYWLKRQLRS